MAPPKKTTAVRRRMISQQLARFTSEGQSITGLLKEKGTQVINEKTIGRYILENEVGTMIVNGTAQIDEAMVVAEIGQLLEIKFIQEVMTTNGFYVKQFEVYVLGEEETKDEERQEPGD